MNECSVADLLGGNLILAGLSLELLKLKLQLIEEPRLAFIARPEDLPLELLDGEPQMRDQRLRTGRLGMLLGKLGIAGAKEPLQRLRSSGSESTALISEEGITLGCVCEPLSQTDSQCRVQPAASGRHVCCGARQSIPSSR